MRAVLTFEECQQKPLVPKHIAGLTAALLAGAALTPINMPSVEGLSAVVSKAGIQSQASAASLTLDPPANLQAERKKDVIATEASVKIRKIAMVEAQIQEEKIMAELKNKIVLSALTWLGIPYKWGGRTKAGVDCSGLVQRVFLESGIKLPRSSYDQFKMGVGIPKTKLQPGDLVFFTTNGAGASHVGIYLQDGQFISATKNYVEIQSLDHPYWAKTYRGSRRIIGFEGLS